MGNKKPSAALNEPPSIPNNGSITSTSNYTHKIANVDRATCDAGQRDARTKSKTTDLNHTSAHHGKNLGLGNKAGLGGTHRHSLEKLKEYES